MSFRTAKRVWTPFLLCGLFLVWADTETAHAGGLRFRRTGHYSQAHDETEMRELWLLSETITAQGRWEESLFGVADQAILSGQFAKDIWISAKQITFDGHLDGSARLVARSSILADGRIGSSIMALAGRTIKLDSDVAIQHDALLMAHDVVVQGQVGGDAAIWAKRAIINGHIDGNVFINADEISVLRGAYIGGDLVYSAPREQVLDQQVHVGGEVRRRTLPARGLETVPQVMIQFFLYMGALISGILFIALFPRYTGCAVRRVRHQFWSSALAGGVAFFLIPMATLLALVSIVGIPAGLLLAAGYACLLYLAKIVVGLAVGGVLLQRRGQQPYFATVLTLALGLLLLYFLAVMPLVGTVITVLVLMIGLGGLILGIVDMQQSWKPPPLRERRAFTEERTRDTFSEEP